MPEDILTVPAKVKSYRTYLVSGNEYISFPQINPKDGSIASINVLHAGAGGLLEFTGHANSPLLSPYLKIDGQPVRMKMAWSYREFWIPTFTSSAGQAAVRGQIYAPPGHRGAVYLLRIRNAGKQAVLVEAGFDLGCEGVKRRIFRTKKAGLPLSCEFDRWTNSLLVEVGDALPLAALGLGLDTDEPWWMRPAADGCRADAAKVVTLQPGEDFFLPLYLTVNVEGSGAGTTVVDLRRHGWSDLLIYTETWLKKHSFPLSRYAAKANLNLFFNYFFAAGRTIDTDSWTPVTSRSPKYYVSAAFWSRDTLLWSFPGLMVTDPQTAKKVLLTVYERHLERAGEHAHYITGALLYPGFELDQLSAYALALKYYLEKTGDRVILEDVRVKRAMITVMEKLLACYHEEAGLCSTFLDPSDDPVRYPYLIYDNALAHRALTFLAWLAGKGWPLAGEPSMMAAQIRNAIYRHGVVKGPFGPMFAWAVDGKGNYQLYNNPPGSLQLLPYYGFCRRDEPVWLNTVQWIHSQHNPYWHNGPLFSGAASRHAGDPWPLAAANDLLGINVDEGRFFAQANMDSGLCCETVDPRTGRVATGQAFASAAGFIGYALCQIYGDDKKGREKG